MLRTTAYERIRSLTQQPWLEFRRTSSDIRCIANDPVTAPRRLQDEVFAGARQRWRLSSGRAATPVRKQVMRKTLKAEKPESTGTVAIAKTRRCLMCSKSFHSSWAGERICRKCKATATWRSG